jgi:hypothetical protein
VQGVGEQRTVWEVYGAKWIFIVGDAGDNAAADAFIASLDVSFGWSTNDADNSPVPYAIRNAIGLHGGSVPWTGVIRTSDMQIAYEANGTSMDYESIATELYSP